MINKIFNSFFLGSILLLLLDFLFFVGIKINYIDFYKIREYYNVLFVDHQSYILFVLFSIIFGFCFMQKKTGKIFAYIYIILVFVSCLTFFPTVGKNIGEFLFRKNNLEFKLGRFKFKGDLLYRGRKNSYIYRKDLNKIIKLKNSEFSYSK